MPCRPTAEEEAWGIAQDNAPLVALVEDLDQQRSTTLQLLNRLLELTDSSPVFRQMAKTIIFSDPRTLDVSSIDDPRLAARQRVKNAEEHLCIARHSLLQFVSFMPPERIKSYSVAIEIERLKHLSHRHDDFEAELRELERKIQSAAPILPPDQAAPSATAELARLRAELVRLKSLEPADLLASRDFSTGHSTCAACSRHLPLLPGLDPGKISAIVAELGRSNRVGAISLVRSATGLGLMHAKFYIDCPHVVPGVTAVQSTETSFGPALCPTCFYEFPIVSGISSSTLNTVLKFLAARNPISAIRAVQEATSWNLETAKNYIVCPHRTP